jgi:hypothetical protein
MTVRVLIIFLLITNQVLSQNNAASKKGVAFSVGYESSWQTRFDKLNPYWHYSWNWEYKTNYPSEVEFVPMIWGSGGVTQERIDYLNNLASSGVIKNVLTFNEPDLGDQADMTVDEAVALWPLLETLSVPISSPATSAPLNDWMREFMNKAEANNLRIDFVAIHIYHKNVAANFLALVEEVYQAYGKPIWITEFAVRDMDATTSASNKYSEAYVLSFMNQVLTALDELDYVKRYSWFDPNSNNPKYPRLVTADLISETNVLTALGDFYAKHTLSTSKNNLSNINLSPNPASNTIYISEGTEALNATIYGINGQRRLKQLITNKIDVTGLENGLFFLKLKNDKNETISKIVIKK